MATKKKGKENVVKFAEPPVTSYPHNPNRVVVIDWASLSYHQMYSMKTAKNKEALGVMDDGDELLRWRNMMFSHVLSYVKLFNPKHMIFALEGKSGWRKQVVRDYYSEHTEVYYDASSYYVVSDNYAYSVSVSSKNPDGSENFRVVHIPLANYGQFTSLKHRKLGELPQEVQDKLWNVYTESGTPIIPSYKGQRKSKPWPFSVDKRTWMEYKDTYASELAPLFRTRAVKCQAAEGDDIIYSSVMEYAKEANEVIVITRDSDMSQIDHPKVKIFNHVTETFVKCAYPQQYLAAKVLSGDSSDNIHGIAFIDVKTGKHKPTNTKLVGEGGAITLMEACPNIYETAKNNGWADQYLRNKTLIDLSMVPDHVKKVITEAVRVPEPPVSGLEQMDKWGINSVNRSEYMGLRSLGYYAVTPLDIVDSNPDVFKADEVAMEEARAYAPMLKVFDTSDVEGVFSSPLIGNDEMFLM